MRNVSADMAANRGNLKSQLVMLGFRIAHVFAVRRRTAPVVWVLGILPMTAYRLVVDWCMGIEIPARTSVGPGLVLWHGQGLVVHPDTVIGSGVVLRHNTTIGTKDESSAAPVIEDGADIGSNAVVIGPIVVGKGAVVGAGAVVTHDVPPGAVVAGNPARTIGSASAAGSDEPERV